MIVAELVPFMGRNNLKPQTQNSVLVLLCGSQFSTVSNEHPYLFYMIVSPPPSSPQGGLSVQRGFVEGRSTITQPLDTVHRITRAIDQGCHADVAFLDFIFQMRSIRYRML